MANVGTGSNGKTLIGAGVGASPTYADIGTNSGLTTHGVVIAQGNGAFQATAEGATGQVLVGNTGSNPTWATHSISDLHDSIYIVGSSPSANYTTLAVAYAAAVSAGAPATVFLQPGTYTEDLIGTAGINICAHGCDDQGNVTIVGKISASFAGTMSISGIELQTNSDYCISVTGSSLTRLDLLNCNILATNHNAIEVNSSGGVQLVLQSCQGSLSATYAYLDQAGNSLTQFVNCFMINNGASVAASTVAGSGSLELHNTFFYNAITNSSTSNIICSNSYILGNLTINSTGLSNSLGNCSINGQTSVGTGATLYLANCTSGNSVSTAITGLGTIVYSGLCFSGSNSLIDTTNQIPHVQSNDAIAIKAPGAYPYTTVAQDALIIVDTSEARTIIPMANPATGQRHVIKDNVGSAAANPITITPSGKNIDGASSFNLNSNWASITITYNGTQWNIT
jgi:hypothetical protein